MSVVEEIVNRSIRLRLTQWQSLQAIANRLGFVVNGKPAVNRLVIHWLNRELTQVGAEQREEVRITLSTNPSSREFSPTGEVERFSDLLPENWLTHYRRLRDNPNLVCLREDLALLELLQREVVERLEMGELKDIWLSLTKSAADARAAHKEGDQAGYSEAINKILRLIAIGGNAIERRGELMGAMELKAKLVKIQSDLDVRSGQLLPRATYEALIEGWQEAVKAEVGENAFERITARYSQSILERSWAG